MPFEVSAYDGVLTLTLDTPGSPINVFNHATADQLIKILAEVTPSTTRAIVFETAKANSFINGVGLLLAHASQTYDDIVRASTPPWTAYRAVREAPVPTVAVVQGSCFGCGVEFALNCDYRIAAATHETQFYMTELNDYLFIPLFGSTWNLPEAVGLADAIDLLLWGERWGAERAYGRGLIDEVALHQDLPDCKGRFVQRVLEATQPSRRRGRILWGAHEDRVLQRARQRVASLPPQYQRVYTDALDLLVAGARQSDSYVDHQAEELRCSAASALSPIGKSAYAFFYLRQMASERAAGRFCEDITPATLCVDHGGGEDVRAFAEDLRKRRLSAVRFGDADAADFRLIATPRCAAASGSRTDDDVVAPYHASRLPNGRGCAVAVQVQLAAGPGADVEIYAPTYRSGGRLIELATRAGGESSAGKDDATRLTRILQRFGFEVARTTPVETFVSTRLLIAYLIPLVRFVELSDDVGVVNAELRDAGFVQRPHDLLATLDHAQLAEQLAAALGRTPSEIAPLLAALGESHCADGRSGAAVIDALCISLLDAVLGIRAAREVRDPSITDLIARELLDFPRHLCSLCTWLKRGRVARAVGDDPRVRELVTPAAFETARAFAAEGREFYR